MKPQHFRTSKFPPITNTDLEAMKASQGGAVLVPQNKGFCKVL